MKRDRGLSLIELVVAMALFALVAVFGTQTLNVTLKNRDAFSAHDTRARDLNLALALLRADLERAAPVVFFDADSAPQSALASDGPGRFSLSVHALPATDGRSATPFGRVSWRLDPGAGQLMRRSHSDGIERLVLTGVNELRIRSFHSEHGWVSGIGPGLTQNTPDATDGDTSFAQVANRFSDSLPIALEVTLDVGGIGGIPVLEVLP